VKRPVVWLATLGPAGWAPLLPATVGSACVTVVAWFIPPPPLWSALALLVLGTAIAIWAAGEAEKDLGHDAGPIVIDEAVGQSISLLFVPHTIVAFAISFVLFRIFDIWKPLGAREAQRLPGGFGVVIDDIIAGITACGAFHAGAWVLHHLRH
jgi:phosphatidylglycerophosphatase A